MALNIRFWYLISPFAFVCAGCDWPWSSKKPAALTSVIQAFQDSEKIENEVFSKLVFTYEKVFNKSATQKFLVKDQLGRKWLFKVGKGASDGSTTMYRLFRFLGLETPEIHKVTFNVNGTETFGTLQRFVKNLGDLEKVEYSSLPKNVIDDLVKNNIMSWLTASHHVHFKQFLLASSTGEEKPDKIYRIDNTIEWFLMGYDQLAYNYTTPVLWHMGGLGYTTFWRRYFQKKLDPDLQKILDWARFISAVPDDFYADFFKDGFQNDLAYFPNTVYEPPDKDKLRRGPPYGQRIYPDIYHPEDRPQFRGRLLERKKNLGRDVEAYFHELAKFRKAKLNFSPRTDFDAVAKSLIQHLKARDEELKADLAQISALPPGRQQVLEPPLSIDGYRIAMALYSNAIFKPGQLKTDKPWDKALDSLEDKRDKTASAVEKKALTVLIERVKRDRENFRRQKSSWKTLYNEVFQLQEHVQKDGAEGKAD